MKIRKSYLVVFLLLVFIAVNLTSMMNKTPNPDFVGKAQISYDTVKQMSFPRYGVFFMYIYGIPLAIEGREDFVGFASSGENRDKYIHGDLEIYPDLRMIYILGLITVAASVLLAYLVFRWTNELYGFYAGILALLVYVLEPNITALSQITQLDLNVALMMFLFFYTFWRFEKNPTTANMIICGVAMALAVMTKNSAIFLYPIAALIVIWIVFIEKKIRWKFIAKTGGIIVVSLILVIITGSIFHGEFVPLKEHKFSSSTFKALQSNPLTGWIVPPFPKSYMEWTDVIGYVNTNYLDEDAAYRYFIMGEYYQKAPWYYLPLMFLIKVPIPIIILSLITLILYILGILKIRKDEIFLIAPFVFMILPILETRNASGIRYILFLFPLLFVLIGRITTLNLVNNRSVKIAGGALLLWLIISAAIAYPFHFSYFNEFIGGTRGAYDKFRDADIDYNLDIEYMRDYVQKSKEEVLIEPCPITQDMSGKLITVSVESLNMQKAGCYKGILDQLEPEKIIGSWVIYRLPQ